MSEVAENRKLPGENTLIGRRLALTPIVPQFHRRLYEISLTGENAFRWRFHGHTPSFEEFEQTLHTGVLCQYAVVRKTNMTEVLGLVVAYNADLRNGYCYVAAVSDKSLQIGILEGVSLLAMHVLVHWPFRKIYWEAPEYNAAQFASAVRRGMIVEEGRLRNHHYLNDQYWDHITYALYRENPRASIGYDSDPVNLDKGVSESIGTSRR